MSPISEYAAKFRELNGQDPLNPSDCPTQCPIYKVIERQNDMRVVITAEAERTRALERWQLAQNGTLQRLETKLDRLLFWMIGFGFTSVLALAGFVITLLRTAK